LACQAIIVDLGGTWFRNPEGVIEMHEISRCVSCDYHTAEKETKCPKCGQRLRTMGQARRMGGFQIVIGTFLVALMGVITFIVTRAVSESRPGDVRFTGTSSDLVFIYGIFAVVIAIGLVSIAGGIMTIKYGKTNKVVFVIILGLAFAFYILAMAFNRSSH
jgi:hypothetical protein